MTVVAVVEVAVGDKVLAQRRSRGQKWPGERCELHFAVGAGDTRPEAQVGVRVSTLEPIDAAVTSVEVARFCEPSPVSESVA